MLVWRHCNDSVTTTHKHRHILVFTPTHIFQILKIWLSSHRQIPQYIRQIPNRNVTEVCTFLLQSTLWYRVLLYCGNCGTGPIRSAIYEIIRNRIDSTFQRVYPRIYRSEIWQASRQRCCLDTCQISERLEKFKPESRGFETLRDLAVRRLTA